MLLGRIALVGGVHVFFEVCCQIRSQWLMVDVHVCEVCCEIGLQGVVVDENERFE